MATPILSFQWACEQILRYEGSEFTNDPVDPGGATKWGITLGDYRLHLNPKGQVSDIRNLSRETAIKIYKKHYWDAVKGDQLPFYMGFMIFDFGVNAGIGRGIPFAGTVLGAKNPKVIDDDYLKKALAVDPKTFIGAYHERKMQHYHSCGAWWKFGAGWTSRANNARALANAVVLEFGKDKMKSVFTTDTPDQDFKNLDEGEIVIAS